MPLYSYVCLYRLMTVKSFRLFKNASGILAEKDKISEVLILLRASFCILRTFLLHIFFFDQVFFFFSRQLFDRIFPLHCFLFSLKLLIIDQCDRSAVPRIFCTGFPAVMGFETLVQIICPTGIIRAVTAL